MNDNLYYPPDKWFDDSAPFIYLAGGDNDLTYWQNQAIHHLHKERPDLIIAAPCYSEVADIDYAARVSWELYHIRLASAMGVIVFWLPKLSIDAETVYQLSEYLTHLKYRKIHQPDRPLKIAVGIEDGCSLEKYLGFRIMDELPGLPIYNTLKLTCEEAIKLLDA